MLPFGIIFSLCVCKAHSHTQKINPTLMHLEAKGATLLMHTELELNFAATLSWHTQHVTVALRNLHVMFRQLFLEDKRKNWT